MGNTHSPSRHLWYRILEMILLRNEDLSGQFLIYRLALELSEPDRILYLAFPVTVQQAFFQHKLAQLSVKRYQIKRLIYKTTIAIAHRLSTIRHDADFILELEYFLFPALVCRDEAVPVRTMGRYFLYSLAIWASLRVLSRNRSACPMVVLSGDHRALGFPI